MFMLNSQNRLSGSSLGVWLMAVLVFVLVGLTACTTAAVTGGTTENTASQTDIVHETGEAGVDHHDEGSEVQQFVPNNGAEVHITSPENEAVFKTGANVPVTIETTDFSIGDNGNHWHVYLDGVPTMVMGGNSFVLQNLSAGQHEIQVFLSLGTHKDLEQGDQVTITVQ